MPNDNFVNNSSENNYPDDTAQRQSVATAQPPQQQYTQQPQQQYTQQPQQQYTQQPQQQYTQQPQQQYNQQMQPQYIQFPPPPKKNKTKVIVGSVAGGACAIMLGTVLALTNAFGRADDKEADRAEFSKSVSEDTSNDVSKSVSDGVADNADPVESPDVNQSFLNASESAYKSAQPIYEELKAIVDRELNYDFGTEYDANDAVDETLKTLDDLGSYIIMLDGFISELPTNTDIPQVEATYEYLTMLRNVSSDIIALADYSLDFADAFNPILVAESSLQECTTFSEMAYNLYIGTGESLELINAVTPPSYMAIAHSDFVQRIAEYQEFAVDFYKANELSDPLRIHSCVNRINRISIMFSQGGENLQKDIITQFEQFDNRLNGIVATLDDELSRKSDSYTYQNKNPEPKITFTAISEIFPSSYRSLQSLVVFTGYSDYGEIDVLIEVEIPGFTQLYKQKVTLGRQLTNLRIIPPLVAGDIDLNSEKTAQLVYSVTNADTGAVLVQESKNIKLHSKLDMLWMTQELGDSARDNILAWMTPDAPEIQQLIRDAIEYLDYYSNGALNSLIGYQSYNFYEDYYYDTWAQAIAIQGALSDITGVRYNASSFTMDAHQRVKLPADTINSKGGLCIETSLVMASALQALGMHAMLVFPPAHAMVAVEAKPNTGDYFLIETTVLPLVYGTNGWNTAVQYLTKDEWYGFLDGTGSYTKGACYVLDCDLGEKLGIRAMTN